MEALKQQIDSIQDKYHFPKLRKVGEFTGDLFIDSGAIVQPGVYDSIPKTPEDYPEGTTSPKKKHFAGSNSPIDNDVPRTLPEHESIAIEEQKQVLYRMLGNILRAFCFYINTKFPDFCYQQGMNFLLGSIIINYAYDSQSKTFDTTKEEKCFWIFYNTMTSHKYLGLYFVGSHQTIKDKDKSFWYVSIINLLLMKHFLKNKPFRKVILVNIWIYTFYL